MEIRAGMCLSADGFVGRPEDGMPSQLVMPDWNPGAGSHGHPEFIEGCDAAVMGRTTFLPALGAPSWPWPGLQVYVLTSSPLPPGTPADVIASGNAAKLARELRSRPSGGDVHLVGGPRTIRAFTEIGELDRVDLLVLPVMLGGGVPLSPPGAPRVPLKLLRAPRAFPDGTAELVYAPGR
jgi:dihydrofolate reductase